MRVNKALIAVLVACISACVMVYSPGLGGEWLLDDLPNLTSLGLLHSSSPPGEFWRVIWFGQSGILRRPMAMITFALQHSSWPNDPFAFRTVNLSLHLACGVLVFWLVTLLTDLRKIDYSRSRWAALVACAFWLFNPIQVSTVLYVIQRMAQLACLFSLLAICLYLKGRMRLADQGKTTSSGYALMTGAVAIGTLLASLSKENGVLLPLMILTLEATVLSGVPKPGHWRRWSLCCLWMPTLAVVAALIWIAPGLMNAYDYRPFSLSQRLLTEPIILFDYVWKICFPRPNSFGLLFDDYPVANSLAELRTFLSLAGLAASAAVAWILRRRTPWASFVVLWFLAGHLLESSFLPLELYFEHRNYLPSVSIATGVGILAVMAWKKASAPHVRVALILGTITIQSGFAFVTAHEAALWGNPVAQIAVWSKAHPHSVRGQMVWGAVLASFGQYDEAAAVYEAADKLLPNEPFFAINGLALRCVANTAVWPDEGEVMERLHRAKYSKTVLLSLEEVANRLESKGCIGIPPETWVRMMDTLIENPRYESSRSLLWFTRARIQAFAKNFGPALTSIDHALAIQPTLPYYTYGIFWAQSAGLPDRASSYLERARQFQKTSGVDGVVYGPVLDDWERQLLGKAK